MDTLKEIERKYFAAPTKSRFAAEPIRYTAAKVGRNDPCPCGKGASWDVKLNPDGTQTRKQVGGVKFKHCHGLVLHRV